MFPYAMINASLLLNSKKKHTPQPPSIETLPNYIQMPTAQFHNLLVERSKKVGIIEMCNLIDSFHFFDALTEKHKIRFVRETIEPEYYSAWNTIKRMFKKK
jgi:hypothetical protein